MRHDDPTNFLAACMKEVHHDVQVESPLLPLMRETFPHRTANLDSEAHADLQVQGFWTHSCNAFFDTRVFYPHMPSYQSTSSSPSGRNLKETRRENMVSRSMKWSMAQLHLLFSHPVVVWVWKPQWWLRSLLMHWSWSGMLVTAELWHGCVVVWHSPLLGQPSDVSGVSINSSQDHWLGTSWTGPSKGSDAKTLLNIVYCVLFYLKVLSYFILT